MESAELVQYDNKEELPEAEVLEGINPEEIEGTTDVSIDFDKQELLDGEEVVMEGLSGLSDAEGIQVIQCEDEDVVNVLGDDPRHRKVDKDDPRSRLHYIKYLKKEGKPMKMWECGICGKEFRHQYTLMRHLPTHTDERNYKCEDCGKAFRQMSTLSQHRAIHSDARPYVCEYCKKTFNRVSTLISHRKTHSDMKPHKCPVCFKGFHQKGNLRNHVFTHTNARPYKCEICEKGFNQMSNLVCHKAHVHGDKSRHVCQMCGSEFLRRYALRLHQEYTHGIVYQGGSQVALNKKEVQENRKKGTLMSKKNGRVPGQGNTSLTFKGKQTSKASAVVKDPPSSEVIIDPIETKAMQNAKDAGQTTFALFKPAKGIPVLVKVMPAPNNKQMLVPATVEDLKSAGKITVSPNYESGNSGSPIKAVQIKVPVVATVIQRIGENGQLTISVESPGPEQTSETSPSEEAGLEEISEEVDAEVEMEPDVEDEEESGAVDDDVPDTGVRDQNETFEEESVIQYIDENGAVVTMDGSDSMQVQYLQDDGTLVDPSVIMHPDGTVIKSEPVHHDEEYGTSEIIQMETDAGIQLVRATGDGTYEVISDEEAAILLQNQDHGIEILDSDHPEAQYQQILEEGENGEIVVNQNSLSALVSAIRSAGYEVMPGEEAESMEDIKTTKGESVQEELGEGAEYL